MKHIDKEKGRYTFYVALLRNYGKGHVFDLEGAYSVYYANIGYQEEEYLKGNVRALIYNYARQKRVKWIARGVYRLTPTVRDLVRMEREIRKGSPIF